MSDDLTTINDSVIHTSEEEGFWTDPETEEGFKTKVVKTYIVWENTLRLHSKDNKPAVYVEVVEGEKAGLVVNQEWWINNYLHRESGPAKIYDGHEQYYYRGVVSSHLKIIASAKGITSDSWAELVKFAKSEGI